MAHRTLTGLVGWRGMVGSVLMDRMAAEDDFGRITPVFFSTSNAGGKAPRGDAPLARADDLEAHVLDASNVDRPLKVHGGRIGTTFTRIVDQVFQHFTESPAFLVEVQDVTETAILCRTDGLFNTIDQVGTAGANVTGERVTSST